MAESIQRPPAFVLGNLPDNLSLSVVSEFSTGAVRCYRLRDVCMTFDGILLHGGQALSSTHFNHPDYHIDNLVQNVLGGGMTLPARRVQDRAVMLSGPGYTVYGHWLVDILPRLWVLRECGYDPDTLRYVIPAQVPAFVLPLLQTFGIRTEQLIIYDERSEFIQFDELLLPTNLRRGNRLHPRFTEARDFLMARATSVEPIVPLATSMPKLFVSRRDSDPSRSLINRDRVEQIAVDHGFVPVQPECMTNREQIALFMQARQVIGEYGSGLHNAMFSMPGAAVCAIRGTSAHPGFIQSGLSHVCGHHTGYVLGDTPIEAVHQSFSASEQAVLVAIKCLSLLSTPPPVSYRI